MTAYTLDRIEGHIAVLLLQSDESIQKDIHIENLPEDAQEGDLFEVTFEEDGTTVKTMKELKRATADAKKEADTLLEKILTKNKR